MEKFLVVCGIIFLVLVLLSIVLSVASIPIKRKAKKEKLAQALKDAAGREQEREEDKQIVERVRQELEAVRKKLEADAAQETDPRKRIEIACHMLEEFACRYLCVDGRIYCRALIDKHAERDKASYEDFAKRNQAM